MDWLPPAADRKASRLQFVVYWATFVREHPDQEWGAQHKAFMNALMESAKYYPLTAAQYLKGKGEPCTRGTRSPRAATAKIVTHS